MSGASGTYGEKKVDVKARGPRDPAPEGITEWVCIFSGPPKYVTELLVDNFRRCCSEGGATP